MFAGPQKTYGLVPQAVAYRRSGSVPARRHHSLGGEQDGAADGAPQVRNLWTVVTPCELIFAAWLIAAGGLAACYPLPRGWTAPTLHAVELLFVGVALAAVPRGWRSRAITTREGQAIGVLVVVELVVALLGAWAHGSQVFDRGAWDALSRLPYAIGWAVLCWVLARQRS